MKKMLMIIAIDGHSSCGKSTIAKSLAKRLGFTYVDTGAMYRAVTLFCQQNNLIRNGVVDEENLAKRIGEINIRFQVNNDTQLQDTYLNDVNVEKQIRSMEVAHDVSLVSKIGFVRKAMVEKQQEYGKNANVIMDGRDIGTVVFPNADYKFFVTASPEIRAKRRYDELMGKEGKANFDEILENLKQRDLIDSTRKESPLRQADDAILVDTSNMTREGQLEWILSKIQR
ncbi:MAG: (d)CMP kinase [Bacteroidales bacterium]|nr:(d)CMP kinase [Bacteroidales bacterium]